MAMSFTSVLKGRLAERILVTLLERGGYRVARVGIEELFDEVKYLSQDEYLELKLPPQLRTLPDLLVADATVSWAKLIEVKFRRTFDGEVAAELHDKLSEQRKYWQESYAILMIGEPFVEGGGFHQDFIRVIPPGQTDLLTGPLSIEEYLSAHPECKGYEPFRHLKGGRAEAVWNNLPMMTCLFTHWKACSTPEEKEQSIAFWTGADEITGALRSLARM
jgi:hypothetical protein